MRKNLTSWAGQLETRLLIFQGISDHQFWKNKCHNSNLRGLLKISVFLKNEYSGKALKIYNCINNPVRR